MFPISGWRLAEAADWLRQIRAQNGVAVRDVAQSGEALTHT